MAKFHKINEDAKEKSWYNDKDFGKNQEYVRTWFDTVGNIFPYGMMAKLGSSENGQNDILFIFWKDPLGGNYSIPIALKQDHHNFVAEVKKVFWGTAGFVWEKSKINEKILEKRKISKGTA